MIDILATEQRIEDCLNEVNGVNPNPSFKIYKYPGSLDELGKPLNCLIVVVSFKSISYEPRPREFVCKCTSQVNTANWSIDIYSINVRDYHKIIKLSEAIIKNLKDKTVGILDADSLTQGVSPVYLSNFAFVKAEEGFCYQFSIDLSFQFTDRIFC